MELYAILIGYIADDLSDLNHPNYPFIHLELPFVLL